MPFIRGSIADRPLLPAAVPESNQRARARSGTVKRYVCRLTTTSNGRRRKFDRSKTSVAHVAFVFLANKYRLERAAESPTEGYVKPKRSILYASAYANCVLVSQHTFRSEREKRVRTTGVNDPTKYPLFGRRRRVQTTNGTPANYCSPVLAQMTENLPRQR